MAEKIRTAFLKALLLCGFIFTGIYGFSQVEYRQGYWVV